MNAIATKGLALGVCGLLAGLLPSLPSRAEDRQDMQSSIEQTLTRHPEMVEKIVRDYLVKHPEMVQQALDELAKRRTLAEEAKLKAAIIANASLLLNSPHQAVLGNPKGSRTIVQFFDYNCGYCKHALADTLALLHDEPNLKMVLKELPVLGPGSVEAARVAVAVRMQNPSGAKYLEFHKRLLGPGSANKARAMAVAKEVGCDPDRLEQDMASEEVAITLNESAVLAQLLGIKGTPSYVVGDSLLFGAVGVAALQEKVRSLQN